MDVVIDKEITVLEVLAFGNAVGGDEQVNLAFLWQRRDFGAVFGTRRKVGEDLIEVGLAEGRAVATAARNQRDVNTKLFVRPGRQGVEQVFCGVSKGGEYEHLFV